MVATHGWALGTRCWQMRRWRLGVPDERGSTPPRPLADSERRKASQKAPSSLVVLALADGDYHHADVDDPAGLQLTFWVSASSHR